RIGPAPRPWGVASFVKTPPDGPDLGRPRSDDECGSGIYRRRPHDHVVCHELPIVLGRNREPVDVAIVGIEPYRTEAREGKALFPGQLAVAPGPHGESLTFGTPPGDAEIGPDEIEAVLAGDGHGVPGAVIADILAGDRRVDVPLAFVE